MCTMYMMQKKKRSEAFPRRTSMGALESGHTREVSTKSKCFQQYFSYIMEKRLRDLYVDEAGVPGENYGGTEVMDKLSHV